MTSRAAVILFLLFASACSAVDSEDAGPEKSAVVEVRAVWKETEDGTELLVGNLLAKLEATDGGYKVQSRTVEGEPLSLVVPSGAEGEFRLQLEGTNLALRSLPFDVEAGRRRIVRVDLRSARGETPGGAARQGLVVVSKGVMTALTAPIVITLRAFDAESPVKAEGITYWEDILPPRGDRGEPSRPAPPPDGAVNNRRPDPLDDE